MPTLVTISTSQFTTIADSAAKALLDLRTNLVDNASSAMSNVEGGQLGGTNSMSAHIAALTLDNADSDLTQVGLQVEQAIFNEAAAGVTLAKLFALYAPVVEVLERETGGIASFLQTNSLVVHPAFADAVNYVAQNYLALNLQPVRPITAALIFPSASATLGTIAVTGSAAGTFTAGSTLAASAYSAAPAAPLTLANASVLTATTAPTLAAATASTANASALAAGSYTVGYTFVNAHGETLLSSTASQTVTAGQYINVSSIAFPSGATAIKFYASIAAGSSTLGYTGVTLSSAAAVAIGSYGLASAPVPSVNTAAVASTGTATAFTVTYTSATGASATVNASLSGALAYNGTLALGVNGSAVTGITVNSGGNSADTFVVSVAPARSISY